MYKDGQGEDYGWELRGGVIYTQTKYIEKCHKGIVIFHDNFKN